MAVAIPVAEGSVDVPHSTVALAGQVIVGSVVSLTVVVAVALLLVLTGSVVVLLTVAVFDSSLGQPPTVTTIVIVAVCPGPGEGERLATLHVTVPDAKLQPALAETKVVPAGSGSDTLTPVAVVVVLRLVTLMV